MTTSSTTRATTPICSALSHLQQVHFNSLPLHFQALHELLARLPGYDLQMHSVVAHTRSRTEARISAAQNIGEFVSASDKASD